jgi:tetraacyldisaccharide 4'-kinase
MRADELWYSDTPKAKALRTLLTPLSWLYAAGWQAYLNLYLAGLKKPKEPHKPVICVGNLTTGGSGKTPLTLHLFDLLKEMGREVVVSCSGYGSEGQVAAALAPEEELVSSLWGDEAAMLRWLRPEMRLIVGRNRVRAADICHREFPSAVLLLDDGFQHLPLRKHLSIVLDESNPKNSGCLPAGPYREPRRNRSRADLVLPGEFQIIESSKGFFDPRDPSSGPEIQEVQVLCALGRPDRFLASMASYSVKTAKALPDHDPLTGGTLFEGFDRDLPIVVTAKDWVKLRRRSDLEGWHIRVAMHETRIEPAAEFREFLHAALSKIH